MSLDIDALICGGGVTGLWLRSLLREDGRSVVLIEADALGAGQTIASQGILHNGAKYAAQTEDVGELLSVLSAMSFAWRPHLKDDHIPALPFTTVTTEGTWYWNPEGPLPACLDRWWDEYGSSHSDVDARDPVLPSMLDTTCGSARYINERTISPASLLNELAGRDRRDLWHVDSRLTRWSTEGPGDVTSVTVTHPEDGHELELRPHRVFFTAGAGNAALRETVGLSGETVMQRRPLQMGLVRGKLPTFCGHWFDEHGPRLTISTQFDDAGRTIWQLGGRLAENGVSVTETEFITHARREVVAGLPGLDLSDTEWSSYWAVRAEPMIDEGRFQSQDAIRQEGNVITMWPGKLTLVPQLMIDARTALDRDGHRFPVSVDLPDWPMPIVARPPWETVSRWVADNDIARTK